ncbi:MAG: H-NS histone family protein, partial [Alcanivorax sp.]|nr:H-NS histone family protein [Alcanivorax sp.]
MTINLDDLSVAELEKLIKQAEKKLEKKRLDAVKSA